MRKGSGWRRLRLRGADRPAAVPGAAATGDIDILTIDGDRPRPVAVLGHSGIVHLQSRAVAPDEAGFFDRLVAGGEADVGGDRAVVACDCQVEPLERFDDRDRDGADGQIKPLAGHSLRGAEIVLLAVD